MIDPYDIKKLEEWLKLAKTEGTDRIKITTADELDTYKVRIIPEKGGKYVLHRQEEEGH